MKVLLDSPLVMSIAEWVWSQDTSEDVSPERCVESLPIMNVGCWTRLIVKGLGIAIILGACLNKAPVMLNIWNSKSTAGLSRGSIYGDIIVCANGAFYGLLEGHPLTAFGESIAMTIQSIMIMLLMWRFTDSIQSQEKAIVVAVAAAYIATVTSLPNDKHYILMTTVWPVYIYSRGSQIWETCRVKHSGAQSVLTTSLNLVGSLVRILTTIKEVGMDFAVLTGYILGVALNLTLLLLHFYYRKNTEKFLGELMSKKQS